MKRRILSLLIVLAMALSAMPVIPAYATAGTADDPLLISSAADLMNFRNRVNNGESGLCATLTADINISSVSDWEPIANRSGVAYTGTFDGQRHKIIGLTINRSSTESLGLFGYVGSGTVKSVAVTAGSITNSYNGTTLTYSSILIPEGYVVGENTLSKSYPSTTKQDAWSPWANAYVSSDSYYDDSDECDKDGYLCLHGSKYDMRWSYAFSLESGWPSIYNTMNNAYSATYVSGYSDTGATGRAGGIAGSLSGGCVALCSFDGAVSCGYSVAGGLLGSMSSGTLDRCYSSGSVYGTYAGGAVGSATGGIISNCYSTASCSACVKAQTVYSSAPSYTSSLAWSGTISAYNNNSFNFAIKTYKYVLSGGSSNSVIVHNGSFYGFVCDIGPSATITNSYYYQADDIGRAFSNNIERGTSTYILGGDTAENENCASLTTEDFADTSKFTNWDFKTVWTLTDNGRPVLYNTAGDESVERDVPVVPEGEDAVLCVKADDDEPTSFNLADIIKFANGKSTAGRFFYTVVDDQFAGGDGVTVEGDLLTVKGSRERGDYFFSMTADDIEGNTEDFQVTFTIRAQTYVAEPVPADNNFPYSRKKSLGTIGLPTGWKWVDEDTIPMNDYAGTYDVVYEFGDTDKKMFNYADAISATYDEESNSLKASIPLTVTRSAESPWVAHILVVDADTDLPIEGATVEYQNEYEFPDGHLTDENGLVLANLTQGKHDLLVSAPGYVAGICEVQIEATNSNEPKVSLIPQRTEFTVTDVREKYTEAEIPNPRVLITKVSDNPTKQWSIEGNSFEADSKTTVELPDGDFTIKSITYGYTTKDMTFVRINRLAENEADRIVYYTDSTFSATAPDQAQAAVLHEEKLNEPTYHLTIEETEGSDTEYTATLTIRNIKATFGTFGLRWDPEIITFDPSTGITFNTANVKGRFMSPESMYAKEWTNDLGYYDFVWSADDRTAGVLDTETETKEIATFKFNLKNAEYKDLLTVDTFGIQPWTETYAAKEWADENTEADPDFDPKFYEYWRDVDSANNKAALAKGRIEASKSVVNGVDTNGFFQAAVNGSIGTADPASFYDVMTELELKFPLKNSVIRFHVTDKDTGENVFDSRVRLFDYEKPDKLYDTKNTDVFGRATFAVDTSEVETAQFTYDISKKGYWPLPLSGLVEERPDISARTGKVAEVNAEIEKIIYHDPKIIGSATQSVELVQTADLGGERYAYNGRDFHFRIKGAKGWRIKKYPTKAYVSIGDDNAGSTKVTRLELRPNENGLFTLDADYIKQQPLTASYMTQLGYSDVYAQPDDEGFRSYNIEIEFDEFETEELEFTVEGMTNAHGTVKYDAATPVYEGEDQGNPAYYPEGYSGEAVTDIKVKTKKSVRNEDMTVITPANHKTGTFTFEAEDGYKVEKVYINGLEVDTYNDMKKFSYSFGEVDMDSSIVVMFWDGKTPSEDTMLTLVVGDFGFVDVTSPVEIEDMSLSRRVFLNPEGNLEFNTRAINDDYELYKVTREIEGEAGVDITRSSLDGSYKVSPVKGKNVITYVTFRNKLAETTPNLFVKSYVYTGQGITNPAGILIYNMYDSVEIGLEPDTANHWKVKGVMLSPYDDIASAKEYDFEEPSDGETYRYDSLTESIAIGAIFIEKTYHLEGIIDLGQKADISGAPVCGATVKFVRLVESAMIRMCLLRKRSRFRSRRTAPLREITRHSPLSCRQVSGMCT